MSTHPRCSKTPAPRSDTRRRPRWHTHPAVFPLFRAGAVAAAVLLALLPVWLSPAYPAASDAGIALAVSPEAPALSDASTTEEWASLPIPPKPLPNQETRCEPKRGETSIRGGCYLELKTPPPCAEGQFDHEGRCWMAVGKRERPRTSVQE